MQRNRRAGDGRTPVLGAGDPLVRACAVLVAVAVGWFALNALHPVGPPVLLWATVPLFGPLVSLVFHRASRADGVPADNRDFWRRMTPAPLLVSAGQVAQAADALAHPEVPGGHTTPLMLTFDGIAILVVISALSRLPTGRQEGGDRLRILLDGSTVVLATAVFIWHFGTRQAVAAAGAGTVATGAVVLSLILVLLALLGAFAVAKVLLSEHRPIDTGGLRLIVAAIFVGALAPMSQPLLTGIDPRLVAGQVSLPVVFLLAAAAAARQRFVLPGRRPGPTRPRPFSLLPYTAVVAVDGVLLWVALSDADDVVAIASAAVLLTAVVVVRQVTALRDNGRLLARLDHGATHDALTGLANRVLFQRRLQRALTAPGAAPVTVVLLDLDDFKEVNDTLGHEVGDLLLVEVATRLARCVRAGDTVSRLGGDEFVMVLPGSGPAEADEVAARLIEALHAPVRAGDHELAIRASIGIADGRTGDEAGILLRRADIAMYAAKTVSGTAHRHYHDGLAGAAGSDYARLTAELREAIETDRLFLLYQPIVALDDGRVIGAEALVRWAHPVRGVLPPDAFLPVAERSGLTVPLGRWVLRNALRQLAEWPDGPLLSINLSARDLREPDLATDVAGMLAAYGVDGRRITLEITETVALEGGRALATLQELRDLGVRISLDDFGTGFSTLSLLHRVPVDEIKLDRSFAQALVDGRVPMAAAVIHLAQVLGLHAVAEGVEDAEQARQLLGLGYIAAQGYHFARPMPPDRFAELLSRPTLASA